eukprot:TRINITY_DN778009_c0_g1_i1.p1 TRINITY_DN778009_c0_g1~~TRINITY_DN778009_c0_g1_i1.p1  ORF type:complete len:218 (-),score=65.00 TRINITY_DN778009_c0_g1_i1:241-894(-)
MSKTKGISNVERRTWDLDEYAEKAALRAAGELEEAASEYTDLEKKVFAPAAEDESCPMGSERAYLQARKVDFQLENKVGKREIINDTSSANKGGFWCPVCCCLLKDSVSFYDHINGRKHQLKLGRGMRIKPSSVNDVKNKLKAHIKKKEQQSVHEQFDYSSRIKRQEEAEAKRKKRRALQRKKEKEQKEIEKKKEEQEENEQIKQSMGFGGFSAKRR